MSWRQRSCDFAAFAVVWLVGAFICDVWLRLNGTSMFFGGAITGVLATLVSRAAREAAAE